MDHESLPAAGARFRVVDSNVDTEPLGSVTALLGHTPVLTQRFLLIGRARA